MTKKLELEMSEFLLAAEADNINRMAGILGRLSFDQKERMARGLLKGLYPTLFLLPPDTTKDLMKEFGFEIKVEEIADVN